MQNPLNFHSLRSLFTPQEVTYLNEVVPVTVNGDDSNDLTAVMPIDQVVHAIDNAYYSDRPIYITVSRRNANLYTKDIFFGFFRTPYRKGQAIAFHDVDQDITRLFDVNDILATRLPE